MNPLFFLTSLLMVGPMVVHCKPVDSYWDIMYAMGHGRHRDTKVTTTTDTKVDSIQPEANFTPILLPTNNDPEMGEPLPFDNLPAGVSLTEIDKASRDYVCDTTKGSARLHDIDGIVDWLRKRGGVCVNTNITGSHCTKLVRTHGTTGNALAAVSLCGRSAFLPCSQIADWVVTIKEKCAWDKYAGGRWYFAEDGFMALHK